MLDIRKENIAKLQSIKSTHQIGAQGEVTSEEYRSFLHEAQMSQWMSSKLSCIPCFHAWESWSTGSSVLSPSINASIHASSRSKIANCALPFPLLAFLLLTVYWHSHYSWSPPELAREYTSIAYSGWVNGIFPILASSLGLCNASDIVRARTGNN